MSPRYRALLPAPGDGFSRAELDTGILARFHKMVRQHGSRTALRHGQQSLTYAQLEQGSAMVAAVLRGRAKALAAPVAMLFRHGVQYPLAQLAVLRAGACFASLDAELPQERLLRLMADLGAGLVLHAADTREQALALAAASGVQALDVDAILAEPSHTASPHATSPHAISPHATSPPTMSLQTISPQAMSPQTMEPVAVALDAPAYIVYTSGSTGTPQGVVVSHANVLHFCWSHTHYMHINPNDRATQLCPLWTAASAAEIFPFLLNGATLYPWSVTRDGPAGLVRLLQHERITTLCAVPVLFRLLMAAAAPEARFPAMRLLRLAGDRTTRRDLDLLRKHFGADCLLRVGLGASEALLYAQHFLMRDDEPEGEVVPVGYPVQDMELLLLDERGQPVPQGEYGEIAVRSRYLSLGYWQNPALTAQRFLPDPHGGDRRVYLSRDIGYIDARGLLHHVGRSDARVKLHGRMVVVSDVEEILLALPGVNEAVVVPYDSGTHGTELAAFVVAPGQNTETLRRTLTRQLPPGLLPRRLEILDALPLQLNNKINRLQLKALCRSPQGI